MYYSIDRQLTPAVSLNLKQLPLLIGVRVTIRPPVLFLVHFSCGIKKSIFFNKGKPIGAI
jgi:hypothetical protein